MGRWVLVSARSHKVLRTYSVLTRLWCPFPDRSAFLRSHAHGHPHMDLLSPGSEFTPLQPVSVGSPQRPSSREGKAGCGSPRTAVFGKSSLSSLSLLFPHTASPVAPGGQCRNHGVCSSHSAPCGLDACSRVGCGGEGVGGLLKRPISMPMATSLRLCTL